MTQPKRFEFESTDGLAIACVKWEGHHNVRGVVQIDGREAQEASRATEFSALLPEGHDGQRFLEAVVSE